MYKTHRSYQKDYVPTNTYIPFLVGTHIAYPHKFYKDSLFFILRYKYGENKNKIHFTLNRHCLIF